MTISQRQYMEQWIAENFDLACVSVKWKDDIATIKDKMGEELTVEMKGQTLYADGKPFGGIPSLLA